MRNNTWRPPTNRYPQHPPQRWQALPGTQQPPPQQGQMYGPPNPQAMTASMHHQMMPPGSMMGMTQMPSPMHAGNMQPPGPQRMLPPPQQQQQQFLMQQQMMQQQQHMMMHGGGGMPQPPGQNLSSGGQSSPTFTNQPPAPPGSINTMMDGQTPSALDSPSLSAQGLMEMPGFGLPNLDGATPQNIQADLLRGVPRLVPYRGLMNSAARPLLAGRPGTLQELQMVNNNLRAPVKAVVPEYSFMKGRSDLCRQIAWLNDKNIIVPKVAMARFVIALLRQSRAGYKPADALSHSAIRDTARRMYERLETHLEQKSEDHALINQEPAFRRMPAQPINSSSPTPPSCAEDWAFFTLAPFSNSAFWGMSNNPTMPTEGNLRMLFEAEDEAPPTAAVNGSHHYAYGMMHHPQESQREDGWAFTQRLLDRASVEYGGPLGIKSVRRLGLREEASEVVSMLGAVFKNRVNRVLYLAEQQARDRPLEWSTIESCLVSDIIRKDKFLYKEDDLGFNDEVDAQKRPSAYN